MLHILSLLESHAWYPLSFLKATAAWYSDYHHPTPTRLKLYQLNRLILLVNVIEIYMISVACPPPLDVREQAAHRYMFWAVRGHRPPAGGVLTMPLAGT